MPGDILRNTGQETRRVPQFLVTVIESRDDQGHHFNPKTMLPRTLDSIQGVLKHTTQFAVILILHAFEIYFIGT